MPVPAHRKSSSRKRRGQAHLALKKLQLILCPKCNQAIKSHQVCKNCGTYKSREVIRTKTDKKIAQHDKKEKKAKSSTSGA